jgi:type III secretion protein V
MSRTGELASRRRYADVALGALVLAIIALMIVPVPTALLDVLIAGNIALAVLMLLMALAIPNGLAFTAMPTVLLVTTLYRLALNVSSTRLILLQADAGRVIRAFGEYVVAGNYAVGAVVFAILTLIQYVVVARGAERVAEVGARFTLDAMPGKQMAIDADLRAGAIAVDAARERRRQLEREGQFFGAMDGAMKFVKGDAIAGIVIVLVNVVAGVAIGVSVRELGVRESLATYGLLAIGDGLVCQIPSLLISTSAGLVVTRVAGEDERASLGGEVSAQLFGNARVLLMGAFFLLLLAVVPGLPAAPFAVLALLLAGGGVWLRRSRQRGADGARTAVADVPALAPIALELAGDSPARAQLHAALARARTRLLDDLGMPLPEVEVRGGAQGGARKYLLRLWQVEVARGELPENAAGDECAELVAREVETLARQNAAELFGVQETQQLLDGLSRTAPALVHDVCPKPISLRVLCDVLRCLLDERVGIRALGPILEALSQASHGDAQRGVDAGALADQVRVRLRRQITAAHAPDGVVAVHAVDPMIEDALRDALPVGGIAPALRGGATWGTGGAAMPALPPDQARDIVDAVRAAVGSGGSVLLTQPDVRRHLRALLRAELPEVAVLSYPELVPDARVARRAPIRIGTGEARAEAQAD